MKIHSNFILLTFLILAISLLSCSEKEEIIIDEGQDIKFLQDLSEANLEAQQILLQLFQEQPFIAKELLQIGVRDEGILFETLLNPVSDKFQRLNPKLKGFKDIFRETYFSSSDLNQRNTSSNNSNTKTEQNYQDLIKLLVDAGLEIYMPYIEEDQLDQDNITVVAATLSNEGDLVKGYKINLTSNQRMLPLQPPTLVDVDDNYASGNNTLILQPIDDYYGGGGGYTGGGSSVGSSGGNTGSSPIEVYDSLYRMHIQVGHMRCPVQYDKLVNLNGNAGASEFKFFRAKPEYNFTEEKVEAAAYQIQAELSRKQIRENRWVHQFVDWDFQWEDSEVLQGFAIYEWDNTDNKVKIKGNVEMDMSKKLKVDPAELGTNRKIGASFEAEYSSKHTILIDQDINREYFYNDVKNKKDYGHGFYDGRTVRKAGSLYYTLNTFTYFND